MQNISVNELKEKYSNESIDLTLENHNPRVSLNLTGGKVQVLFWGEGEPTVGYLEGSDWTPENLAKAFGISPDESVWVMNDRI